jgi:predicted NAD/FAD-binding protein
MEPLVAAVWSCDPDVALDYPARYLFTFLDHHGMLGVFGSPDVAHRHRRLAEYVARVAAALADVRLGTKVTSVLETADGVEVTDGNGDVDDVRRRRHRHPPGQALAMLAEPTRPSARCSARCRTPPTPPCCTPTPRCCRGARARASWNFRAGRRRARHGDRHLRPDPAQRLPTPRPTTSSRSAARTSSTRRP